MAKKSEQIKYSNALESFVLTLRADHLESGSPGFLGGSSGGRQIFYDEIEAIYRYRQPDWSALTLVFLIATVFGLVGLGIYFAFDSPPIGILCWIFGLAWCAYFIYSGFIRQKSMVRLVATSGTIEFRCKNEDFFQNLMSHLKVKTTVDAVAPAPEYSVPLLTEDKFPPTSV